MRKLGLVLVLLFTLSIVSATDFTLSGKITPKTGVTALVDGDYPADFTFSDGTTYSGQVTMTNGVFVADFSGMTNAESAVAASDTITMAIYALGGTQTFSNIPLTTVPKAVHATTSTTARSLDLNTPKQGSESTNPEVQVGLNTDLRLGSNDDSGRYWHFRSGGFAIPTVFSYYGNKQLELNRELATFYGNLNVGGTTKLSGKIYQDWDDGTSSSQPYDVWIQGSKTVTASDNNDRNLALLGNVNTDRLYLNWRGQYEGGTEIGSATAPTSVMGDLTVGGTITGDGSGITGLVGGNSITKVADTSTGAAVTGDLTVSGDLISPNIRSGLTGAKVIIKDNLGLEVTNDLEVDGDINVGGDLETTGVLKTAGAWFGRQVGTYSGNPYSKNYAIEQIVKHFGSSTTYDSTPSFRKQVFEVHGSSTDGPTLWPELIAFDATKLTYSGVRGLATFVCGERGSTKKGLYKSLTGQYAWSARCIESGANFPCEENDDIDYELMLLGARPDIEINTHWWQEAPTINPHTVSGSNMGLRWTEGSDTKLQLKAAVPKFTECTIWLEYTM